MTPKKDAPRGRGWRYALPPAIAGIVVTVGVALAMTTTDQAMFCGSCHSMAEAALAHKRSVHAELACNECHAPHNLIAKIPFKTKEGTRDIVATVTSSIPDLIHPGEETKEVLAGDIAAVVGLKDVTTGETLCDLGAPIILERMSFQEPVITMAVEP